MSESNNAVSGQQNQPEAQDAKKKEKKARARYRLYDKIPLSVKQMDYIIAGIIVIIVILVVVGIVL